MISPEQTTFKRIEASSPDRASVWIAVDVTHPSKGVIPGVEECTIVEITPEEQAIVAGIINRGRAAYCERLNATLPQPSI